jgi:hypothetical protein
VRIKVSATLCAITLSALTATVWAQDNDDDSAAAAAAAAAPAAAADAAAAASAAPAGSAAPVAAAEADAEDKKPAAVDPEEAGEDEPIEPDENRKGEEQFLGLSISSINKIDPTKNVWEFDGVLRMETKGRLRKCDKTQIQSLFPEGELKKVEEIDDEMNGALKVRRCKVTVEETCDIDITRYPFDRPVLEVQLGDDSDSAEGVAFKPIAKDGFDLGPKATLPGWEFDEPTAEVYTPDAASGELPRVIVSVEAQRPLFSSFIKAFLAVSLQLVISCIGLFLPMKVIANRLTLTTAALIAVAATHSTITGQISVPYLTTADKFFMATYLTLLVNLMFNVLLMRADDQKKEAAVKSLSKVSAITVPVLGIVSTVLVLFGIL